MGKASVPQGLLEGYSIECDPAAPHLRVGLSLWLYLIRDGYENLLSLLLIRLIILFRNYAKKNSRRRVAREN